MKTLVTLMLIILKLTLIASNSYFLLSNARIDALVALNDPQTPFVIFWSKPNDTTLGYFKKWNVGETFASSIGIAFPIHRYSSYTVLSNGQLAICNINLTTKEVKCIFFYMDATTYNSVVISSPDTSTLSKTGSISAFPSGGFAYFFCKLNQLQTVTGSNAGTISPGYTSPDISPLAYQDSGNGSGTIPGYEHVVISYNINSEVYFMVFNKTGDILTDATIVDQSGDIKYKSSVQILSISKFVICWYIDVSSQYQIWCKTFICDFSQTTPSITSPYPKTQIDVGLNTETLFSLWTVSESEYVVGYDLSDGTIGAQKMTATGVKKGEVMILDNLNCSSTIRCRFPHVAVIGNYLYFSHEDTSISQNIFYGKTEYIPICSDFSITTGASTNELLNFTPYIKYYSTLLKVKITSLPNNSIIYSSTVGTLNSINTTSLYSLAELVFSSGSTPGNFIVNFQGVHDISQNLTTLGTECILTITTQCYVSCATCSGMGNLTSNMCITCALNYYKKSDITTECFSSVPSGYYFDSESHIYLPCYERCATCISQGTSTNNNCTSCKSPNFTNQYMPSNCNAPCASGEMWYYDDNKNYVCSTQCPVGTIVSENKCVKCSSLGTEYTYKEDEANKCYLNTDILEGYIYSPDLGYFKKCYYTCLQCSQVGNIFPQYCTSCKASYFLHSDMSCYSTCPDGFYGNSQTQKCETCIANCSQCSNDSSCQVCSTGYFVSDGKCATACPIGEYPNKDKICNICLQAILNNECVDQCPTNYIPSSNKLCMQCQNGYVTYDKDNKSRCQCNAGYTGDVCELIENISNLLQALDGINQLTNFTTTVIDKEIEQLNQDSANVTTEQLDQIFSLIGNNYLFIVIDNQTKHVGSEQNSTSAFQTLKVTELALAMITTANKRNTTNYTVSELQDKINIFKKNINSYTDLVLANITSPVTLKTSLLSIQYSQTDPASQQILMDEARANNLSILNFTKCENAIKVYYNIPKNASLILKKIDYSPQLTLARNTSIETSNSLEFEFYNPITLEKLNSTIPCKDENIIVSMPLESTKKNETLALYTKMLNTTGIDIFDPNSTAFTTRCFIMKENKTQADMTVNKRIQNFFQNKTPDCGDGCKYSGIDSFGYVMCSCDVISARKEVSTKIKPTIIQQFPKINIDIVLCFFETYQNPNIFTNPGNYLLFVFLAWFLGLGGVLYYLKIEFKFIDSNLNTILNHDAVFFQEGKLTKEEYFLLGKRNIINFTTPPPASVQFPQAQRSEECENCSQLLVNQNHPNLVQNWIASPLHNKEVGQLNKDKEIRNPQIEIHSISSIEVEDAVIKYPLQMAKRSENISNPSNSNQSEIIRIDNRVMYNNVEREIFTTELNNSKEMRLPPTIKDLQKLNPYDAIIYDKRKLLQLFWDLLLEDHQIIWMGWKKSLYEPIWYRMMFFFMNLSLIFAVNGLVFTDDYIEARGDIDEDIRNSFEYTILHEYTKTLLSLVITVIILFLIRVITSPTKMTKNKLNDALITMDKSSILIAFNQYNQTMKWRYRLFALISLLVNLFCWYYAVEFCGIYIASSTGWIYSSFIGLIMDWCVISLAAPILRAGLRLIIRKYPKLRFLIAIEYVLWMKNIFS